VGSRGDLSAGDRLRSGDFSTGLRTGDALDCFTGDALLDLRGDCDEARTGDFRTGDLDPSRGDFDSARAGDFDALLGDLLLLVDLRGDLLLLPDFRGDLLLLPERRRGDLLPDLLPSYSHTMVMVLPRSFVRSNFRTASLMSS